MEIWLLHPYQQKIYADTLLSAVRFLDSNYDIKGWIVELRDNDGGIYPPMIAGLSPILGPGYSFGLLHLEKEYYMEKDSIFIQSDGNWESFTVAPPRLRKKAPIAVLTGGRTGSAGEVILISFKGLQGVKFFGEASGGVPTAPKAFTLRNKGSFTLTSALWCDRTGICYSASIPPDVEVLNPENKRQIENDPVIKAAKEWLHGQ